MAPEETHRIEVGVEELEEILREAKAGTLSEESYAKLEKILASFAYMTDLISEKGTTIARLRHLLFGPRSERSRDLLAKLEEPETKDAAAATGEGASGAGGPNPDDAGAADDDGAGATGDDDSEPAPSGHGRNGAEDYTGAERREVKLEGLKAGDPCPVENCKGRLYRQKPGVLVRVKGQAPLLAIIWALEKLRCGLCGKVFTARAPEGLGEEKYDESARAMLALLKYGTGLPLNRLEKLEGNLGIPLPSSSQWEVLEDLADEVEPVFRDLVREAAQGEVLHNDDTPMKILSLEPPGEARSRAPPGEEGDDERTGLFTSGIVSRVKDHQVALYFTGRKHAGENLADVLKRRAEELGPPIQMLRCALAQRARGGPDAAWELPLARTQEVCRVARAFSRGLPHDPRRATEGLSHRRAGAQGQPLEGGAAQAPPGGERPGDGVPRGVARGPALREEGRAELGAGPGHPVHAEALEKADALFARGGGPPG